MKPSNRPTLRRAARGFTLVELLVAGVIAAFVLGSVAFSLAQVGRTRTTAKLRFDAFLRQMSLDEIVQAQAVLGS